MEFCDIIIATIVILTIVLLCTLFIDNKPALIEEPKPFEPKPIKPARTTAKSLYANPPVYNYATSDLVSPALTAAVLTTELTESKPYIRESQYECSIVSDSDSDSSSSSGGCD